MDKRIALLMLLLGLLVNLQAPGSGIARAEDDEPAAPPAAEPADPPAAEPADPPAQTDPADPAVDDIPVSSSSDDEEDETLHPRLRPSTDEEERAFKRQATLNDPFLNPLIARNAEASEEPGYNPRDHFLRRGYSDLQRFMVQDPGGEVQGFLSIHSQEGELPMLGRVLDVVKLCEYEPACRVEMQVQLDSLRPTLLEVVRTGASRSQQALDLGLEDSLHVEYLFDRVSIRENIGGITGMERQRMLPFSFDISQLDSLVRSLDFNSGDWPLQAVLFDPEARVNNLLYIERPKRVQMTSAEPKVYGCWQLDLQVGNEAWTYWVERLEPNRIIRFQDPRHTYTLMRYSAGD